MGREEQQEEREVLDSIFPEEITGTNQRYTDGSRRMLIFLRNQTFQRQSTEWQ